MRRAVILAHHDPDGIVDPHVVRALERYRVVAERLVVVSTAARRLPATLDGTVDTFIARDNTGYDFGSWRAGLAALSPSGAFDAPGYDEVLCVNDSVYGPLADPAPLMSDPRAAGADLWGMVLSRQPPRGGGREPRPHLQSWFFAARRTLLAAPSWQRFWEGVTALDTKEEVVARYELGLSERAAAGFRIAGLYDAGRAPPAGWADVAAHVSSRRPLRSWRLLRKARRPFHNPSELLPARLLAAGVPYLKVSLLRVNHYGLDPGVVRADLAAAAASGGYDAALVDAHLARITARGRPPGGGPGVGWLGRGGVR